MDERLFLEEFDLVVLFFVFDLVLDFDDELLLFFFVVLSFIVVDLVEFDFFVVFVVSLSSESELPDWLFCSAVVSGGAIYVSISNIFDGTPLSSVTLT